VASKDRSNVLDVAREFSRLRFAIKATGGTRDFLAENGVESELISKLHEGRPNIDDAIKNGEIQLVINTPIGKASQHDDSYIRKAAIKYKVPYITTAAAASAAAKGIAAFKKGKSGVKSLQEYHADIEM
jgi:carbamoyl-phosphate synthase large subunit